MVCPSISIQAVSGLATYLGLIYVSALNTRTVSAPHMEHAPSMEHLENFVIYIFAKKYF
jgi:hypothetical protein